MNYDKNSFLAGLAVGRKLGWNDGEPSSDTGSTTGTKIIFGTNLVYVYTGKVLANADIVFGELTEEA